MPRLQPVLRGVLYRAGTPTERGLEHLCRQGFRRVYSLYGARTTARGAPNQQMVRTGSDHRRCRLPDGSEGTLEWIAAPSSRGRSLPRLLRDVMDSIRDPSLGPILIHCWNGLHYAGMVSALILRQLCGASAQAAEAYWWATTRHGDHYPSVPRRIRAFRPLPGFALSASERDRLCPDLSVFLAHQEVRAERP